MHRVLITALVVSVSANAEPDANTLLGNLAGTWAIGSTSNCARAPYELTVSRSVGGALVHFRDRAGQINIERVEEQRHDGGFTSSTIASPTVALGTRWDYTFAGNGVVVVRNLEGRRQFTLLRCSANAAAPSSAPASGASSMPPSPVGQNLEKQQVELARIEADKARADLERARLEAERARAEADKAQAQAQVIADMKSRAAEEARANAARLAQEQSLKAEQAKSEIDARGSEP